MDGPVVIPEPLRRPQQDVLHGGLRRRPRGIGSSPAFASVPTALMRQGNFSEITTPIRNPFTGQPFPGQHHSAVDAVADLAEPAAVLPGGERRREPPTTWQATGVERRTTSISSSAASIRTSATRSGCMSATTGTTASTATSHRRDSSHWRDAAAGEQEHARSPTRTRCSPTLFNDFRIGYHRIDFDTLNPFSVNNQQGAGTALGIPGFDGDIEVQQSRASRASTSATSAAWRRVERTGTSSTRRSRRRTSSPTTAARTTFAPASICAGWRPAGARPTIRADASTSPATSRGYSIADFMLGIAADGDSADRPDPGPRRWLAQRVLRQRHLAGDDAT